MATDLGSVTDVRRITGIASNEMSDADIESYLNEAIRKIRAKHWSKYMVDVFYANSVSSTGSTNRVYETYFPLKSGSTPTIYINGALQTVTTHYTISGSTITFTSSANLLNGDKVTIYYQPDFFDDYANYMAVRRLQLTGIIDTNTSVGKSTVDAVTETIKDFERMIAMKPHMVFARDHREAGNDIY